jgi:hypothetical protein
MSDDERKKEEFPSKDETYDSPGYGDTHVPLSEDSSSSDTSPTRAPAPEDTPSGTIDDLNPAPVAAADQAGPSQAGTSSLIDNYTGGGMLKAARENQELSVDAVARALMLNHRVIESLERTMQPPGYDMARTRIAAKSYAKYLNISAHAVLADFPTDEQPRLATAVPRSSVTDARRSRSSQLILPAVVMAGVVIAGSAIAFLITPGESLQGRASPSVAERVVAVNTAQESLFARTPLEVATAEGLDLSIVALAPSWIEVRGPDGTIFRSRTMARDEVYYPRLGAGWTVTVKSGAAFEWQMDGRAIGRLADENLPIYSASIDEAAALAANHSEPTLAAAASSRPAR